MTRDAGSAFIETLIAAAIIALVLGTTYRAVADSAARHRMAEARRAALLIAQSELAAVGAEIPMAPGRTTGVDGGYVWQVDVSPYSAAAQKSRAGDLYRVAVSVRPRAPSRGLASLDSLRLVPAA